MSEEDRRTYESQNAYKSLLTHVYEVYEGGFVMDSLKPIRDLELYIQNNLNLLTLKENEDQETEYYPFYSENIYSIVAGTNKILQVDDMYIKVFDDGIAVTNVDYLSYLMSIELINAKSLIKDDRIAVSLFNIDDDDEKSSCHPRRNVERLTNNRNRTKVKCRTINEFTEIKTNSQGIITQIKSRVRAYGRIRPYHRTAGIWYHARRTIQGRIQFQVKFVRQGSNHEINVHNIVSPTLSYSQTRGKVDNNPTNVSPNNIRFEWIDSWGTTPNTGNVEIQCN